jgi:hypothetical protein
LVTQISKCHICWNKQNKQFTSFVSIPCFICFKTLLQQLSLSCYTNNISMLQCMRNSCCIYMLHQPHFISNQLWNKYIWICCILMFQFKQIHKWDQWCSCLWNASANMEAKHLGSYKILCDFTDYWSYGSMSTEIWSLQWLFLYLRSYNLVSSITTSIGARFNTKHVICVIKTKSFVKNLNFKLSVPMVISFMPNWGLLGGLFKY